MKIYKISQRIPRNYLDLGHNSNSQPWFIYEDDIKVGNMDSSHREMAFSSKYIRRWAGGRIDHNTKDISVVFEIAFDKEKFNYLKSIFVTDYPGYKIIYFAQGGGGLNEVIASIEYFDIAHDEDDKDKTSSEKSIWAYSPSKNDIFVCEIEKCYDHNGLSYLAHERGILIDFDMSGRIDHKKKRISFHRMGGASDEQINYVKSILEMDYLDYVIYMF